MGEPLHLGVTFRLCKEVVVAVTIATNKWSLPDLQPIIGRGYKSMDKSRTCLESLQDLFDKERIL